MVATSVDTFMEFVENYPNLIRLLNTDQASGPKQFRESIRRETRYFAQELIDDFSSRRQMLSLPLSNIPEVAEMMVLLVFNQGITALEMNSEERQALVKKLNIELRMVLVGSNALYMEEKKNKDKE